jgi:hypothetical protein
MRQNGVQFGLRIIWEVFFMTTLTTRNGHLIRIPTKPRPKPKPPNDIDMTQGERIACGWSDK